MHEIFSLLFKSALHSVLYVGVFQEDLRQDVVKWL